VGGPKRSSILLALLILVVGRLGGPLGGPVALPLDMDLLIGVAIGGGTAREGGPSNCPDVVLVAMAETDRCGGALAPMGLGVDVGSMAGEPLTLRGGPALGGGGVADGPSCAPSLPAFLLTHLFKSGSYTKLLSSPNLALIGLFGCAPSIAASFFENQPLSPHPFFTGAEEASFLATHGSVLFAYSVELAYHQLLLLSGTLRRPPYLFRPWTFQPSKAALYCHLL
jgi:hypothetical protein